MNRTTILAVLDRLRLRGVARGVLTRLRGAGSHGRSFLAPLARRVDWYRELPKAMGWRRALDRELRVQRTPSVTCGAQRDDAVLVVMCLWQRPERLPEILTMLAQQQGGLPIRLVLWNNNPENAARNRCIVSGFGARGAVSSVEYIDSPSNLLGMARFVAIRAASLSGYSLPFAITLDDDQDVPKDFIATLAARGGPDTVAGWWACQIHGPYWERIELEEDGASANYVGTGGSVWPVSITDAAFFSGIPLRYRMIEDLWASTVALRRGWTLTKVSADITFVFRDRDQGHALVDRKTAFYEDLR